MTTHDLIKNLLPLGPQIAMLVSEAADRLEELQQKCNMHYETICDLTKERNQFRAEAKRILAGFEVHSKRDEARAEVEQLKQALHDARLENSGQAALLERTRPEPSRLEIAAMLKAGWFANRDTDFNRTDHAWWIEQADALIAAAREKTEI